MKRDFIKSGIIPAIAAGILGAVGITALVRTVIRKKAASAGTDWEEADITEETESEVMPEDAASDSTPKDAAESEDTEYDSTPEDAAESEDTDSDSTPEDAAESEDTDSDSASEDAAESEDTDSDSASEDAASDSNPDESNADPATQTILTFESFDGGGPEYEIAIDNPEILAYRVEHQYQKEDHEELCGAGYDVVFTFNGLKPGTTSFLISARSPIAENFDQRYTVTVGETLEVNIEKVENDENSDEV